MENENFNQQNIQQTYYPPPVQPPIPEKNLFKKKISFMSGGLLIYSAIMYIIVIGIMFAAEIIELIIAAVKNEELDIEQFIAEYSETDMGMSIAVLIGCAVMILFFFRRIKPKEIFTAHSQKMTVSKFIMLVCVLMCIQFPISIFDIFVEAVLNQLGLSAKAAIESSQAGSTTISMMLYAGFIGPFAEEFIYRGYTMRSLERTGAGKGYALVISSLLFGIMHANPTQSIYAFFAGMVFSYAAMEYGIIWSMLLHIANNFVFGDIMVFISKRLSDEVSNILDWGTLIGLFIAGIIVLIVKRKQAAAYIRENYITDKKYYGWTFTNILFWVFVGLNIILAVMQISKLES